MAEKHARANLVVDSSRTVLKAEDPDSYCPCCQMPYIEDEHRYALCTSNMDLGEMGPGFPLFFQLVKYLGGLMFLLTLFYFLPSAAYMY